MMKSLELPLAKAKEESGEAQEQSGPMYPWGTSLSLDQAALDQLGMKLEDFKIGEEYGVYGMVWVTSLSQHQEAGGEERACVNLQFHEMCVCPPGEVEEEEDEDAKAPVGRTLYKDTK
jgi:hypothetical protein